MFEPQKLCLLLSEYVFECLLDQILVAERHTDRTQYAWTARVRGSGGDGDRPAISSRDRMLRSHIVGVM